MEQLFRSFAQNAADWLTLASTTILGCVTVYFAWRSRNLERRQTQQINREFDRELATAAYEIEKWRVIIHQWEEASSANGGPSGAFQFFRSSPLFQELPDFSRITEAIAFHLPDRLDETTATMQKVYGAMLLLGMMKGGQGPDSASGVVKQLERADAALRTAKEPLGRIAVDLKSFRTQLRQLR